MADKKRVPVKAKKTHPKKTTKNSEVLETSITNDDFKPNENEQEGEMELQDNGSSSVVEPKTAESSPSKQELINKNTPHSLTQTESKAYKQNDSDEEQELENEDIKENRQPDFAKPRNGGGVRPQDIRLSDEYTIETYFDRNQRLFIATVVEYPELRCSGHTRDEAQIDLEERLEDHVYDLKARGGQPVEAIQSRQFPPKLELALSQSLYRKLDQLSRYEKLPIDRLVGELLSASIEKRGQTRTQQPQQNHYREPHHNREHHQGGHQGQNNRHHGGGHRQQGGNRPQRGGGSNYRALDSRENFMEYVRNLEKNGGPGWKKR